LIVLANALRQRGHDVAVAVFYAGGALESALHDVKVVDLRKRGRWAIVGFLFRFLLCVRKIAPDVVHGYLGTANLLTVLSKAVSGNALSVWGVRSSLVDFSAYGRLALWHFKLECVASRFADLIIANSHAGKVFSLGHGFSDTNFEVVHNGIDTDYFLPAREKGRTLRGRLRLPSFDSGITVVGSVGRLDHMKDLQTLIKAAAKMASAGEDAVFVHFGGGDAVPEGVLRKLADELGVGAHIIFAGPQEDMCAAYNALDILCLSSLGEGFPNVVGEAMACGVPCVVTDVGDAAEIVGDTGMVVPPSDPDRIAKALVQLGHRLDNALRLAARTRIVERFSVSQMVDQTERLIRR
jgi:glycosyltransferase involved in cell wall biosynthesis